MTEVVLISATATTAEYTLADLLIQLAISVTLSLLTKPDIPPDQGSRYMVPTDTKNKLPVVYGLREVAGSVTFADISSNNQRMFFIVSICEAPIDAIEKVYWDDRELVPVADNWGSTISGLTHAIDREGTTYDFLNANFQMAVYPEGGRCTQMETNSTTWNANRTLRTMPNVAYAYIQIDYDRDERIIGLSNRLRFLVRGIKVSRVIINSENANYVASITPAYTTNPVDILLDYLTNARYGCAIPLADIDTQSLNSHKLHCLEHVTYTNNSGNSVTDQDRYITNAILDTNRKFGENLIALTMGNSSSISWKANKFGLVSYRRKTSVYSFSEANIYGDLEIVKLGFQKKLNELTVRYLDENEYYTENQYTTKTPNASKNINEPRLEKTVFLPNCTFSLQARRIADIMLLRSRYDLGIKFTTDMSALQLEAGDVISLTHGTTGWTNKLFEIESIREKITDNYLQIEISASEYDNNMYPTGILTESVNAGNVTFPNPNQKITISSLAGNENTSIVEPNVVLTWSSNNNDLVSHYEVEFKLNSATDWNSAPNVINPRIEISPLLASTQYNFRVRAVSINGIVGNFATTINVTTAAQRTNDTTGNNYMISTNGTIIQWGTLSDVEINTNSSVSLPTSFSNTSYIVSCTATNLDSGTTSSPLSIRSKTTSAFTVHAITGTTDANWIAIGR